MSLEGNTAFKYVHGTRLGSSASRAWANVLAERWSHRAGVLPSVLPRETEVAVLLRGRTFVDRTGGGRRQETLGHHGTVWLCPAGIREEHIEFREPMDDILHIFLPAVPFADTMLQDLNIDPARAALRYEAIACDPLIEQIALSINRELSAETAAGTLLVECLGYALSAHLIHHYSEVGLKEAAPPPSRPIDPRRMSRVMDFIHSRIDTKFSVADLAAVACQSPAHFARSFKATTGLAPHAFVSDMRLNMAKRLLNDRHRPISEIALSSGFSSQSNLVPSINARFDRRLPVHPAP